MSVIQENPMRSIVLAAVIAASPAGAETPAEIHTRGMDALERCEHAWFRSAQEEAIKKIRDAGFAMSRHIMPGTEEERRMMDDLTEALRRCREIIYGS